MISYVAINLDGVDVNILEKAQHGLGRNQVAMGEIVGFVDRNLEQRSGRVVRLNDKTVTLMCGQQQWCVAYGLIHRVVDSSASIGEIVELEICEPHSETASDEEDRRQVGLGFRRGAFGWRSDTAIACVKEAFAGIKTTCQKYAYMAAEGAVLFLTKVSPALQNIDSG